LLRQLERFQHLFQQFRRYSLLSPHLVDLKEQQLVKPPQPQRWLQPPQYCRKYFAS
jgi:hypothetical protein